MLLLSNIEDSTWVVVEKIISDNQELVSKFESIGIVDGQEIFVDNEYKIAQQIVLVINGVTYIMRRNDTMHILVKKL